MIKSVEKLRDALSSLYFPLNGDASVNMLAKVDAIEAEIAKRYVELPVDADGVPIRLGDYMMEGDTQFGRVDEIVYDCEGWKVFTIDCDVLELQDSRHYVPRTVDELLDEFSKQVENGVTPLQVSRFCDDLKEAAEYQYGDGR